MNAVKNFFSVKSLKSFAIINAGVLLMAAGVYFFKFPNHFTTGGVSGISIILGGVIPGMSTATLMMLINLSLLLLGFLFFGRQFGLVTCYCSIMFSAETWLFEQIYPMSAPFTKQPLLELMFAMLLPAVGSALLFNSGASSGGTDIIAMILKKYTSLDIGKSLLISDGLIAVSSFFFFGIETGMFSILGLFMKAFMIDSVIENVNLCKFFTIVTANPEEISGFIIHGLNHSATITDAVGAYSGENKKVVLTACRRSEAVKLRAFCRKADPKSFVFITNTSEIIGKGFRSV